MDLLTRLNALLEYLGRLVLYSFVYFVYFVAENTALKPILLPQQNVG